MFYVPDAFGTDCFDVRVLPEALSMPVEMPSTCVMAGRVPALRLGDIDSACKTHALYMCVYMCAKSTDLEFQAILQSRGNRKLPSLRL